MVTRGNVAIYCYNALTAKTWDVTSSEDGKLTSSKTSDTILAKYFSDFVNEAGEMKLVENAKVEATGATTTTYGANQILLSVEAKTYVDKNDKDIGLAGFIDAEDEPRKGKEEVTYESGLNVVAYVPAAVANIANLAGKKVDVIFGEDNVVAYLVVTSDVVDNSFVTAWDYDVNYEDETVIEIDGEEYDFEYDSKTTTSKVDVSIFNYPIGTGVDKIEALLNGTLKCVGAKGALKNKVVADIELNPDDEIEAINFKFSADYGTSATVEVKEYIVEEVTAKKINTVNKSFDIEKLEDEKPRVVRNNEVASIDDIEAGDVLTIVTIDDNIVINAVSNTVEGTLTDYVEKTNTLEIDGTEYNVVDTYYYNVDGETDDYTDATDAKDLLVKFEDEEVTAYLNLFGEVVAVVGQSEVKGVTLGVITSAIGSGAKQSLITTFVEEDNNDVEYLKVKILAEDGTNKSYKIYNENTKKNIDKADQWTDVISKLEQNNIVVFNADADRVIKSDDIEVVADDTEYSISGNTVKAMEVTGAEADIDAERINDTYKYTDSTVIINYNDAKKELISWEAFTKSGVTGNLVNQAFTMFVRGTKIVYIVADLSSYGTTDTQYGIITDFGRDYDEDGDRIYLVTILTEDGEKTFECSDKIRESHVIGDLITFKSTDEDLNEESGSAPVSVIKYDAVEDLEELVDEEALVLTNIAGGFETNLSGENLEYIKVDSVDADTIEFKWTVAEKACADCKSTCAEDHSACATTACAKCGATTNCATSHTGNKPETTEYRIVDLDEDVVVYNLVTGEMDTVEKGDYVVVLDTTSPEDKDADIVVIVK